MTLERGRLVLAALDPTTGHEQRRVRPCVVVSDQSVNDEQRYPLVAVVPVIGTPGEGALHPALAPGSSGLTKPSYALADQVRSVDKRRVQRLLGRVSDEELEAIDAGLSMILGLSEGT